MINPIQTPKARLLGSKSLVDAHQNITGHNLFDSVIDAALLEYQHKLIRNDKGPMDPGQAAAAHLKLCGAHEFLDVFRGLSFTPDVPKPRPTGNIDHRA